jgi:hypothetical protein
VPKDRSPSCCSLVFVDRLPSLVKPDIEFSDPSGSGSPDIECREPNLGQGQVEIESCLLTGARGSRSWQLERRPRWRRHGSLRRRRSPRLPRPGRPPPAGGRVDLCGRRRRNDASRLFHSRHLSPDDQPGLNGQEASPTKAPPVSAIASTSGRAQPCSMGKNARAVPGRSGLSPKRSVGSHCHRAGSFCGWGAKVGGSVEVSGDRGRCCGGRAGFFGGDCWWGFGQGARSCGY